MSEDGADIQSHSLSHPFLTRRRQITLDDNAYWVWLQHELLDSKRLIEKHTGQSVEFLAYPYGDYDHRLAAAVGKAGYAAALTCDFGKVVKGSDPLRMKRFVIDKKMDFAAFRHYLGATPMELAEMTPKPGDATEPATTISARIPNFKSLDPRSVGMALLGMGSLVPYEYDPSTGAITLIVNDAINSLKGKVSRAVVWAREAKTGRRVEATWTFKLPEEPLPTPQPVATAPMPVVPAAQPATSARRTTAAQMIPVSGAGAIVTHAPK
jgi:hypothetical protein